MKKQKIFILIAITIIVTLILCSYVSAQVEADRDWLSGNTITIITGGSAGGSSDTFLRSFAPYWEKAANAKFIVENRPGASGQIGYTHLLNLKDRGCEFISALTQIQFSISVVMYEAEYDIDDFAMLCVQRVDPPTITVLKSSAYQTIEELIEAMKNNPDTIKVGAESGAGGLFLRVLMDEIGFEPRIVNYESGNEMRTALLGGHVDFIPGTSTGDMLLGDEAKPLVVAGNRRIETWPDTPCTAEIWPDLDIPDALGSTRGFAVPAVDKEQYPERFLALMETCREAFESPEYQEFLKQGGELPIASFRGPEEADAHIHKGHDLVIRYKDFLKED